jgi:vacuolar-type H+-ATPase subunit H
MGTTVVEELERIKTLVSEARRVPFSKYVTVDREELLMSINKIEMVLPEEVKEAFLIQKKTEDILKQANFESEEILKKAKEESNQLISESYVLKEAEALRQTIIKAAQEDALKIREDANNYLLTLFERVESVINKAQQVIEEGKKALKDDNSSGPNIK